MSQPIQVSHAWNRAYLPTGGAEKVYLLLELKGTAETTTDRTPVNLSLVLDRSGSMSGNPLKFCKKACQFVVDQMKQEDKLSIVTFDNRVDTLFQPEQVTHKDLMKQKIDTIQTGGSTNLSGGFIQGAQHVLSGKKEGLVNRVILLSDGHANQGITDPQKLAEIAREYHTSGVGITTMGVGDGFDEELMEGIAERGGGNFYYIEKPDDIPGIFALELQGLLSVVAQNIHLTIKPTEKTCITAVYGYRAEGAEGGSAFSLGDVYSQEVKSLLVELTFNPHSEGKHPVLHVEWDYVDVTQGAKASALTYDIEAEFTNNINLLNQPLNAYVEKQIQITDSAKAIEEAMHAYDQGDMDTGHHILRHQADIMMHMAVQTGDSEMLKESQDLYSRLDNFEYSSKTRKELHQQKYNNMRRKKS